MCALETRAFPAARRPPIPATHPQHALHHRAGPGTNCAKKKPLHPNRSTHSSKTHPQPRPASRPPQSTTHCCTHCKPRFFASTCCSRALAVSSACRCLPSASSAAFLSCWEALGGVGGCWEALGGVGGCWEVLGGVGRTRDERAAAMIQGA